MALPAATEAERAELLERARARCFFLDVDDVAARLYRANLPYGIAKIHWMQAFCGVEPDATFVSSPESTVTRNEERWRSGFGYGGVVEWSGDLAPIELKPNCCGMLVAGLERLPDEARLGERVSVLEREPLPMEPVPAIWDFDKGNHFLSLYEVSDPSATSGCPFVAVLHCSGRELRRANPLGPGLYPGEEGEAGSLASLAERVPTPFGPGLLLRGDAAAGYFDYAAMVDDYARRRREAYARRLFGEDVEVLFNESHQGLDGPGRMRLGCYHAEPGAPPWVPMTLRAELPAYLVAPAEIYSEATLEREGLLEPARATGCEGRLLGAAILPHGGGYSYPSLPLGEVDVDDPGPDGARRLRIAGQGGWFDITSEDFAYRGREVLDRLLALGCGRVVATLRPVRQIAP